jgi:hypothetical protein
MSFKGWLVGLLLGAGFGVVLAYLSHVGVTHNLHADEVVRFLTAVPPFSFDFVLDLPTEVQYVILVSWWTGVGASLGHLLTGTRGEIWIALLLVFTLFCTHRLLDDRIGWAFKKSVHSLQLKFHLNP